VIISLKTLVLGTFFDGFVRYGLSGLIVFTCSVNCLKVFISNPIYGVIC